MNQSKVQRLIKNIKEKGDTYLAALAALITAILGAIGKIPIEAVSVSILSILCIISISILRNRWTSDALENILNDIRNVLPKNDTIQIYKSRILAEEDLFRYLSNKFNGGDPVIKAVMIQCSIPQDITKKILEQGTSVTIFLQDEEVASSIGSKQQHYFIPRSIDDLRAGLSKPMEEYKLEIYKYGTPCSVAGIALDNDVLFMCWYTYELTDQTNGFVLGERFKDDKVVVLGHNRAALIIRKEDPGFLSLKNTFDVMESNYRKNSLRVFPSLPATDVTNDIQIRNASS